MAQTPDTDTDENWIALSCATRNVMIWLLIANPPASPKAVAEGAARNLSDVGQPSVQLQAPAAPTPEIPK